MSHEDETYDDYRKKYCLNYVRTFFNTHLDDSWFRSLYSPLVKHRLALQERTRAKNEAQSFAQELDSSLSRDSGSGPCFFVLKARLGGGVRISNTTLPGSDYHGGGSPPKRSHTSSLSNPLPQTHELSTSSQVLPIERVPPHVTDEQITLALLQLSKKLKPNDITIYSSTIVSGSNLSRSAYVQCTDEVRKELIQQLHRVDRDHPNTSGGVATHVPRKEDTHIPATLPLIVECSDPYGRTAIDADLKGGAPEKDDDAQNSVPKREETVYLSTQREHNPSPKVSVLSMAVSTRERIPRDLEAARQLARAYDMRKNIPTECQLEAILRKAVPGLEVVGAVTGGTTNKEEQEVPPAFQDIEDALDVSIAYLRRVHLLSFYNGCTPANRIGDVWAGKHPASTVHLRLADADEKLPSGNDTTEEGKDASAAAASATDGEEGNEPKEVKVDLLVQRLDNAIEKALEETKEWLEDPDKWKEVVVSPENDAASSRLEHAESQVEGRWIENHSLDEDGRARCSFHFCKKLFKDASFLHKHLLKKHSEFMRAEMAACHDESMMQAWDAQEQRPVPPILVDCGNRLGLRHSPVLGASTPLAADPEPELWKLHSEREEQQKGMRRNNNNNNYASQQQQSSQWSENMPDDGGIGIGGNGNHYYSNSNTNREFKDVDDMEEEKVELAFDNVEVPILAPKKKKKKKLL